MDEILKALVFGGYVKVVALTTSDLVNKAIELHGLSTLAATALGKVMTIGAYMSSELKGEKEKLSINIKCDGPIEGIVVAAEQGRVRGYVLNPAVCLPKLGNGKENIMKAIGNGRITVIKDLGMKECYSGVSEIVNGTLDADFAWYF
ncbi:MAG: Hsp33 family molecular chaperone HslO, partial [Clostridia bacterium]|nr:Hsp33 family molecular chaperone HslO [Clostridia bacterium]